MTRFAYLQDALFLAASVLYAANRFLLAPHAGQGFWTSHFNDLLLVPAALPPLLVLYRRLGLRTQDHPPAAREIAIHLAVWAVVCEGVGPLLTSRSTGDLWDIAAYSLGAIGAGLWWNRASLFPRRQMA